jgi:hypothetical protein
MAQQFAKLMFTARVKELQEAAGSRAAYARADAPDAPARDRLTSREVAFIAARDSFYMATVSETGWPYVQHRGGPAGFLKVIDDKTLGFADYRGNKQYVSVGNLLGDDRVSLFLIDYPNQARLKILGHARAVDAAQAPELIRKLRDEYDAKIERAIVIAIEGFDWNCSQHITPRFSEAELTAALEPYAAKLAELEAENAALKDKLKAPPP